MTSLQHFPRTLECWNAAPKAASEVLDWEWWPVWDSHGIAEQCTTKIVLLQDVIARFKEAHSDFGELPAKAVFQMNDTHPTIAVAELMRLLIDQEGLEWDKAWGITTQVATTPPLAPAFSRESLLGVVRPTRLGTM